jgi:hypothetical protein
LSAPRRDPYLFPPLKLSDDLVLNIRRINPWWEGAPLPRLPATRRHFVEAIHRRLEQRLAPIVVVRGPRQIGKTTAQYQVLQDLLKRGVPARAILRVQFDELRELLEMTEPILRIVDWYEANVLGCTLNEAAQRGERTFLFLDEVQNLTEWAPQLNAAGSVTDRCWKSSSASRADTWGRPRHRPCWRARRNGHSRPTSAHRESESTCVSSTRPCSSG